MRLAESEDGRTIHLLLHRCNSDPELRSKVAARRVEVEVIADVPVEGDQPACEDIARLELDEHIGARPLIDATTGREIPLEIDFGDLAVTGAEVGGEELLLVRFDGFDRRCSIATPIAASSTVDLGLSEVELVWPALEIDLDEGEVTVTNDAEVELRLGTHEILLLRGSRSQLEPSPVRHLDARPKGCTPTERWYVEEVVGSPGVAAIRTAGSTVASLTDSASFPLLDGDATLQPGETRIIPMVSHECASNGLPIRINGRWWVNDDDPPNPLIRHVEEWIVGDAVPIDRAVTHHVPDELSVSRWRSGDERRFTASDTPADSCTPT